MKIRILIGAHLSTAPRPYKEACALARAGHDVIVRGVWFDDALVERDRVLLAHAPFRFEPVVDLRARGAGGRLRRLAAQARGRAAKVGYRRRGRVGPSLFGYGTKAMCARAMSDAADLTIVHSEGGLWIGARLLRAGRRVGVDFEDWFSEDLLPEDRVHRPVAELKRLEGELLRSCTFATATSDAMASALADAYTAPRPATVYNAFPEITAEAGPFTARDRGQAGVPSLHWFSQTIGPGRGLESLMRALPYVRAPIELHLRGDLPGTRRAWAEALIPRGFEDRVRLHPTVPNAELPARVAEHDVGLALEVPYNLNKDLTVSNKLFQYLRGGLAVVATDTAGQREVLGRHPDAGALVPPDDPHALAAAIDALIGDPAALRAAKIAAVRVADAISWERQEARVVELAARAARA